jgi:hypothetical protein
VQKHTIQFLHPGGNVRVQSRKWMVCHALTTRDRRLSTAIFNPNHGRWIGPALRRQYVKASHPVPVRAAAPMFGAMSASRELQRQLKRLELCLPKPAQRPPIGPHKNSCDHCSGGTLSACSTIGGSSYRDLAALGGVSHLPTRRAARLPHRRQRRVGPFRPWERFCAHYPLDGGREHQRRHRPSE